MPEATDNVVGVHRFDLLDVRITELASQIESLTTQLGLQIENLARGISIIQHQVADSRSATEARLAMLGANLIGSTSRNEDECRLDVRITELASQIESLAIQLGLQLENSAKGIGTIQHQVADSRSATEARLVMLGANLIGLASRNEDEFRRLRFGTSSGGSHPMPSELYLNLIEASLTGTLAADSSLASSGVEPYDPIRRAIGFDWPATAETMIGRTRMRNLRMLLERALTEGVVGDFIETGVWRGGACIYARAILAAHGDAERRVFVADSFRGLPPPDEVAYPADAGDQHSTLKQLAVSREEVEVNFRRYGLLDDRVMFLEGWFKDTLPKAPIDRLCVLRLDGDMYESTIVALEALYHKVSPGGFVIVDDYILRPCAQAVDEFRARQGIHAPLREIDGAAVWWRVGDSATM